MLPSSLILEQHLGQGAHSLSGCLGAVLVLEQENL